MKTLYTSLLILGLASYEVIGQELSVKPAEAKIFAASSALSSNAVEIDGEKKRLFKIGAARDGIQKAILDEVQPSQVVDDISDFNEDNTIFGAYDEEIVEPVREAPIFIPKLYRADKDEPTTTTTTTTTTTRRPITVRTTTRQVITTRVTMPTLRTTPRAIQNNRIQQVGQISHNLQPFVPPRNIPTIQHPHPIAPIIHPTIAPQVISRPNVVQPLPQQQFILHQQFRPQPVLQTRTGFSTPPPRIITTPRPIVTPPPIVTSRPARPFISQQPHPRTSQNLRTGVCRASIFYLTSSPNVQDLQTQFTHFAVVVSVDQCARTCHEFNCAVAIFDANTKHCQFIPSTAFSIREGQCPNWPNQLFKNNVIGVNSVRISCVTCQRRRRNFQRTRGMSRGSGHTNRRQPTTLQTTRFLPQSPQRRIVQTHNGNQNIRLNGVILRQPTSHAISSKELDQFLSESTLTKRSQSSEIVAQPSAIREE
uniref:Apple domain-containing protein n=1 Tax=Parastrongyloides trichosuri TaxID=131310 RepID=A0A0N4ZHH3_PARTI